MNAAAVNPSDVKTSSGISATGNLSSALGGISEREPSRRSTNPESNPNAKSTALAFSTAPYLCAAPELSPCRTTETSTNPPSLWVMKTCALIEFIYYQFTYMIHPSPLCKEYSRYCIVGAWPQSLDLFATHVSFWTVGQSASFVITLNPPSVSAGFSFWCRGYWLIDPRPKTKPTRHKSPSVLCGCVGSFRVGML